MIESNLKVLKLFLMLVVNFYYIFNKLIILISNLY
jgi:hypothetical protein